MDTERHTPLSSSHHRPVPLLACRRGLGPVAAVLHRRVRHVRPAVLGEERPWEGSRLGPLGLAEAHALVLLLHRAAIPTDAPVVHVGHARRLFGGVGGKGGGVRAAAGPSDRSPQGSISGAISGAAGGTTSGTRLQRPPCEYRLHACSDDLEYGSGEGATGADVGGHLRVGDGADVHHLRGEGRECGGGGRVW